MISSDVSKPDFITLVDICKDHYDEDFNQNYFQQNGLVIDEYVKSNVGSKRKHKNASNTQTNVQNNSNKVSLQSQAASAVAAGIAAQNFKESNKLKKRFVWPDALHKDFVSAVFDTGLKNSNPKILSQMLPASHKITTGLITMQCNLLYISYKCGIYYILLIQMICILLLPSTYNNI